MIGAPSRLLAVKNDAIALIRKKITTNQSIINIKKNIQDLKKQIFKTKKKFMYFFKIGKVI